MTVIRSRWAAIGAAVAVSLGAGGIGLVSATTSSGERTVLTTLDEPCRIASLRAAPFTVGTRLAPLAANETYTITAHGTNGNCTLPVDAVALSLNVTALNATQNTNLRFWATGAPQPLTANLNPAPGQPPAPNAVVTGLSTDGQFNVYNFRGNVEIVVDVLGYYTDHNHDDRYYTQSQVAASRTITQSFSPFSMAFVGALGSSTFNGCPTRATGGEPGMLGLDLPVGAHIDAINASVFDDGSTNMYIVTVYHDSLTATSLNSTLVGTASGGSSMTSGTATLDLSPSIDTTIGAGDSLRVTFATPVNSNGFCGVTVTYTLPPL